MKSFDFSTLNAPAKHGCRIGSRVSVPEKQGIATAWFAEIFLVIAPTRAAVVSRDRSASRLSTGRACMHALTMQAYSYVAHVVPM